MFPQKLFLFLLLTSLANGQEAKHFSISDFGAVADGKTINTTSIQQAIDHAATAGGGVVEIPAGTWRSGSIFLKLGVELNLAENAVLLGSTNIEDYPKRVTRIEGHFEPWRMALVNAQEMDKVRISGISLRYSGFWNLHLYRCRDVLIEGLTITSPTRHTQHRNYMTDSILKGIKEDAEVKHSPLKDNILGPSTEWCSIQFTCVHRVRVILPLSMRLASVALFS